MVGKGALGSRRFGFVYTPFGFVYIVSLPVIQHMYSFGISSRLFGYCFMKSRQQS